MAKAGQMDAVKIMAKDLVRTRQYVKKFMLMKANIQGRSDGCCEDHGKGLGENQAICEKVYVDEG